MCYDALYLTGLEVLTSAPEDGYYDRSASCRCGNVAIIWDEDITPRIYTEDISSVQPAILFLNERNEEVRRVLKKPLGSAIYTNIQPIKDSSLHYQELAKKSKYERVTSTEYNTTLIAALDRYKNTTSDGEEEFLRTARNNPLKGI